MSYLEDLMSLDTDKNKDIITLDPDSINTIFENNRQHISNVIMTEVLKKIKKHFVSYPIPFYMKHCGLNLLEHLYYRKAYIIVGLTLVKTGLITCITYTSEGRRSEGTVEIIGASSDQTDLNKNREKLEDSFKKVVELIEKEEQEAHYSDDDEEEEEIEDEEDVILPTKRTRRTKKTIEEEKMSLVEE